MTEEREGTPRWVKVFGLVAVAVVVLFVVLALAGRGEHGPRRHTAAGDATSQAPHTGTRT